MNAIPNPFEENESVFDEAEVDAFMNEPTPEAPWPDPLELAPVLPAVASFTLDLVPEPLRPAISEIAELTNAPMDFPAAALVTSLAGVTGRRIRIQPKREDSSWKESGNLWGALISQPGTLKSPILRTILKPIEKIESEWRDNQEIEQERYQRQKELLDIQKSAWEAAAKKATTKGLSIPPRPDDTLYEPSERRLLVVDATFEVLHELLSKNAAGIFTTRDELAGWLSMLERAGREGERPFYLSGWNGSGSHTIDRIGRGSTFVPNMCISLFGCMTPSKLVFYMRDAVSGAGDDGLLARFQIAVWPDVSRNWRYIDRKPNPLAMASIERIFRAIVKLSPIYQLEMKFDRDAQQLFVNWLTSLNLELVGGTLPAALQAHLGKYRKLVPTLAALYELTEMAVAGKLDPPTDGSMEVVNAPVLAEKQTRRIVFEGSEPAESEAIGMEETPITLPNLDRAIRTANYLRTHAERIYSCVITPERRAIDSLGRHIKAGDLSNGFTSRDVLRKCWSDLSSVELVQSSLQGLEDLNWIRPIEEPKPATPTPGRPPATRWEINPRLEQVEKEQQP